jgi:hypothetical protein
VTAAQVLESVHRLLDTENPLGRGHGAVAPSRHQSMQGQLLRSRAGRAYVSRDLAEEFIPSLPAGAVGTLLGRFLFQRASPRRGRWWIGPSESDITMLDSYSGFPSG